MLIFYVQRQRDRLRDILNMTDSKGSNLALSQHWRYFLHVTHSPAVLCVSVIAYGNYHITFFSECNVTIIILQLHGVLSISHTIFSSQATLFW